MKNYNLYIVIAWLFVSFSAHAQEHVLKWNVEKEAAPNARINFEESSFGAQVFDLPSYCGQQYAPTDGIIHIINGIFEEAKPLEVQALAQKPIGTKILIDQSQKQNSGLITYCILPFRINPVTRKIEKLVAFDLAFEAKAQPKLNFKTSITNNSVLAQGDWYKLGVNQTGVYKITPQFLADCGFDVSNLASDAIRIFGNGKGMLPQANDENPNPELKEVAIYVFDGGDGVFNGSDYAVFFANGPHQWQFSELENRYVHAYNVYSDVANYFITVNNGTGKRIKPAGYNVGSPTYTTTSFDDFRFIEEDKYNLVGSGRQWFGDLFDFTLTHSYTIQFPDVIQTDTAYFTTRAVARSTTIGTSMGFQVNGAGITSLPFDRVFTNAGAPFVTQESATSIFFPNSNTLQITAAYNNAVNSSATAWLDYIAVQLRRPLKVANGAVVIKDKRAYNSGGVAEYQLSNPASTASIWDVTDFHNVREVNYTINGGLLTYQAPSDTLRTFVSLNGEAFPAPTKVGSVNNQNLHGLKDVEMIIIAPDQFLSEATRLAAFHQQEGLAVEVVTPEQVYNEFSSGMQDITGIKLFLRHLYQDTSSTKNLRYLLLFGDASYDYKGRLANDHNFVPIYQTSASFSLYSSYCTDDYYGYLDENEGRSFFTEDLDIGIGRMPVKSLAEARVAVDKVIHYATNKENFGNWRNRVLVMADDVDESWETDFLIYTDRLARKLDTVKPQLNFEKIYADSYVQVVKAGSQRYPDARADMFRKVERGNLVTSYLGHGGEVGLAKERILQLGDVTGWQNYDNMPVFSTITCEFTRVDDPTRVSAGEQLYLNANGGAVALFSTLRPVFATVSTYNLNNQLFDYMFADVNGEYLSLGEVVLATKNNNSSFDKVRFSLIGDPALYLAIPKYQVVTDEINGKPANGPIDTLKALSTVTIKGHLEDNNGALLANFNGLVLPTVFDKKAPKVTLTNDGVGQPLNYETQENVIYRGKVSANNGTFEFQFVVPLDINFVVGEGKISYYATDSVIDAGGFKRDLLIGGLDLTAEPDDKGPEVRVFINDTNFVSGGLTDRDPTGLALVFDESGINTVGTGIGHDLLGILDGNTNAPFVLNDYFEADLNSYQRGTISYPFFDLPVGRHNLLVRAWDVHNNMGQGVIDFVVDNSAFLALKRVLNFPNPFSEETRFQFEHNRAGEPLEIDIQIFDQQGGLVKRIQQNVVSQGNRVSEITWDGKAENGSEISSGVYVYRVIVRSSEDGSTATDFSKLVFIR